MSEILSLLSLRFRGGAGQERETGACWNLNLSSILLVEGCLKGARCGTAAGVINDANTAESMGSVFFHDGEGPLEIRDQTGLTLWSERARDKRSRGESVNSFWSRISGWEFYPAARECDLWSDETATFPEAHSENVRKLHASCRPIQPRRAGHPLHLSDLPVCVQVDPTVFMDTSRHPVTHPQNGVRLPTSSHPTQQAGIS